VEIMTFNTMRLSIYNDTSSSGLVWASIPATLCGRVVEYIARIEGLDVDVDLPAKVVVNERPGTVVRRRYTCPYLRHFSWRSYDFGDEQAQLNML
jgi:flagellar basal body P-ring protein FlgI